MAVLYEDLSCRKCGSDHVRRSQERGFDRLLIMIGFRPFRCFDCGYRFRSIRKAQQFVDMALPPSVISKAVCPNCSHESEMHLTPEEMRLAEDEGWAVSCPRCKAMFALRQHKMASI